MKNGIVNIGVIGASGSRVNYSHLPNLDANKRAHFKAFSVNETDGARAIVCCDAAEKSIECGMPVAIDIRQYCL